MHGWLIALAVIVLLAVIPLGGSVKYDAGGTLVRIIAGPVRLTLFPKKKKKKKVKEKRSEQKKAAVNTAQATNKGPAARSVNKPMAAPGETPNAVSPVPPKEEPKKEPEKGGSLLDFLPLVQVALDLLGDLRRKLRIDRLELKLILAADDPCDLAVNYGRAWAAVGNLFPLLERAFVIKKRDVEVECDFTSDETLIIARLDLTITLGRLLYLVVRYGIRALGEYLKIKNSRKGGALK